jgi:hypothetical protein
MRTADAASEDDAEGEVTVAEDERPRKPRPNPSLHRLVPVGPVTTVET